MRIANVFVDPTNGYTYRWEINHNDESGGGNKSGSSGGLQRNLTISAPTSNNLHIRQQAASDPFSYSWKGQFNTRAQHQEFLKWWKMCDSHSIILEDFSGDISEVLIVGYVATRKATILNRADMTFAPLWIYEFQMDLDVINWISGDYAIAGIAS